MDPKSLMGLKSTFVVFWTFAAQILTRTGVMQFSAREGASASAYRVRDVFPAIM